MGESRTVVLQARVSRGLAQTAAEDAAVLGLRGPSEAIREGLRLLHHKARLIAGDRDVDHFYSADGFYGGEDN
jgi:hypothetical protein